MFTTSLEMLTFNSASIHEALQKHLITLAEPDYQKFAAALLPGTTNLLGVRLPALRRLAANLAKEDWRHYLKHATDTYFEETMLQGMVIGLVTKKLPLEASLPLIRDFVPRINNWSVCDSFCAGLKFVKEKRAETWDFTASYLKSDREYEFRFGAVMLLNHYLTETWLDDVLGAYVDHRHEKYYAKMAIAWGLSQAFAFDPNRTLRNLEASEHKLDPFVRQKAFQKILESRKVSLEHKAIVQNLKSLKGGGDVGKSKNSGQCDMPGRPG